MFQNIYKSAYDKIGAGAAVISDEAIQGWIEKSLLEEKKGDNFAQSAEMGKLSRKKRRNRRAVGMFPGMVAAVCLVVCLGLFMGVPVAAENIPAFYGVLERNAPDLLNYLIPVQKTDSSSGIVLNLEAAKINGNTAEILVSFTDDGTGDYIRGEVDMYDSYHLKSYSGESNVGGCYFMEYDEVQDKAYFQIDLTSTEGTFDTERMEFNVYQLLTDCQSYTEEISLENMDTSYDLKAVSLNGRSGMGQENPLLNRLSWSGDETDPRPGHLVMNVPVGEMDPETMELTAVSYEEGILKVQLFRGNFKAADRHMNIYLLDEAGNQVYANLAVGWQEEVKGETVSLEEYYFVVPEEELANYTLWGEGEVRAGSIEGEWSINFNIE
ncbi:MAG: DUF4179 domain-containing protein [Lachnospiraceae bacterium]|nr:DUF4179 domain-containing protein [Lachnospiraceae bacterium]